MKQAVRQAAIADSTIDKKSAKKVMKQAIEHKAK